MKQGWFHRYTRFTLFVATLIVVTAIAAVFSGRDKLAYSLLVGFDVATLQFLLMTIPLFRTHDPGSMRERARDNDPDHHVLLLIAAVVGAVVMIAVGSELIDGRGKAVALCAATLLLAWFFGNMVFALHYAHVFYTPDEDGDAQGLEFPGDCPEPDHWDFAYYAFVLGMTFQVSDVQVTGQRMRRLALLHGLLAFVFNIGVIAVSVSIISNLFHG